MSDVSAKIPLKTVEDIHRLLRDRTNPAWIDITWEYQDDFEYVLYVIQLAEAPLDRNAPDRMFAYNIINNRIPRKPNGDDSWMVVFQHNGTVCDSLMNDV
jgi:hypothetical protein